MKEDNPSQYSITIKDPVYQTQENSSSGYVTYAISGKDPKGQFQIRRRYKEFNLLREVLVQRFIGLYIPPISSKKVTGNTDENFVEERRKFLHYFSQKIAQRPYLFDSQIFQLFIRGEKDFQKTVINFPLVDFQVLADLYEKQFSALGDTSLQVVELAMKNQEDYDFVKKVSKKMELLREQFIEAAEVKRLYGNQFKLCFGDKLPKYEEQFILFHQGNNEEKLVLSRNHQYKQKMEEYRLFTEINPLNDYVQLISYDIRETRAFVEAMESKKAAEQKKINYQTVRRQSKEELEKLKEGKFSLKSIFTSGNKEAQIKQLEEVIPKLQKNEENLGKAIQMMNIAIYNEMKAYKQRRSIDYTTILRDVAKKQVRSLSLYGEMLKEPLQQLNK